jgi:acetylornithine/N-succinyldiaminopimelate aminotransferase
MTNRQLFLLHNAQTSAAPLAIEMVKAQGCKLWDVDGKEYIDLIAGISVCNVGHCHPKVVEAIQQQANEYMHVLVYGELVQSPQVQYAKLITDHLPPTLNSVYFTSSGSEATEGAMKLAKKITGRAEMVAFNHSYHGSSQGSLSIIGSEYWRNAFRPLLPGIHHADYNSFQALDLITTNTACVIAETIQAEAGVNAPLKEWITALRKKCTETGTLLILDEIQCGFGRNGSLWAFEQFNVLPDILLLGKALGGGMPMGAFVANKQLMDAFTDNPVLGHITTFGGHPVCCAAGMAAMNVLLQEKLIEQVHEKEISFRSLLHHPKIISVRSRGLMIAVEFASFDENKKIIDACLAAGVFTDWFLFASHCMRIAPPLTISREEIEEACRIILNCLEE